MIFLDETGKRWRAIKRSTTASIAIVILPLVALVAGAYIFNPGWSTLVLQPAQKPQTVGTQPGVAGLLSFASSSPAHSPGAVVPTSSAHPTTTGSSAPTGLTSNNQVSAGAGQSTTTTISTPPGSSTPTPSGSTQSPTPQSKNTDPGNSATGHSHHFTTP